MPVAAVRHGHLPPGDGLTTADGAPVDEGGLTYTVRLRPQQQWRADVVVRSKILGPTGDDVRALLIGHDRPRRDVARDLDLWLNKAPSLDSDWETLTTA